MAITDVDVTEEYASFEVLRLSQLQNMVASIEDGFNAKALRNLEQFALDVFGTYTFNDDGVQTRAEPLADTVTEVSEDETITGAWTFQNDITIDGGNVASDGTFTSSGQHRCSAYRTTTNQTIATSTATAVSFNAESYDVGSLHDNSTNESRITIPSGGSGLYNFYGKVTFDGATAGNRVIMLYKNGAEASRVTLPQKGLTQLVEVSNSVSSNACTLANLPIIVQNVYASAGGSTGNKIIVPSTIAPSAGQARVNMTTGVITFNAADAVTTALVTYLYNAESATDCELQISYQDQAVQGDYYEIYVYQNSGASIDIIKDADKTFFQAMKVW